MSSVFRPSRTYRTDPGTRGVRAQFQTLSEKAFGSMSPPGLCSNAHPPTAAPKWLAGPRPAGPLPGVGRVGSSLAELLRTQEVCRLCLPVWPFVPTPHFIALPSLPLIVSLIFCVQWAFTHPLLKVIKKNSEGFIHIAAGKGTGTHAQTEHSRAREAMCATGQPDSHSCLGRRASKACRVSKVCQEVSTTQAILPECDQRGGSKRVR